VKAWLKEVGMLGTSAFFVKTILSGTHILMTSSGGDQCKNRHAPIWHFG